MTDIFISYSHKDEAWKEALQRHLKVLQAHNEFSIWDDRQIEVGANWLPAIENAIEQAKVALLLVSSDFLTSEFVTRKEIPRFLQRREAEGLQVVPIIIRPCAWMTVPWLAALQGGTKDNRPVINVSWNDAQNYVQWLSQKTGLTYRLPTEAEWEYAARTGTKTSYFWGDNIGKNKANCDGCGSQWDNQQTAPVASFPANSWDLVNMHGNVWEWTQDCYHDSYKSAPEDGSAWLEKNCEYRVLRGGSWNYRPRNLRSAKRLRSYPTIRGSVVGFRISRTL